MMENTYVSHEIWINAFTGNEYNNTQIVLIMILSLSLSQAEGDLYFLSSYSTYVYRFKN